MDPAFFEVTRVGGNCRASPRIPPWYSRSRVNLSIMLRSTITVVSSLECWRSPGRKLTAIMIVLIR
jgi:hypothetical protein